MKHHDLKTWPTFMDRIESGDKRFEIRENDRDFQAGDTVTLNEFNPEKNEYLPRNYTFRIGYVTAFEQKPGFVVFSLVDLPGDTNER